VRTEAAMILHLVFGKRVISNLFFQLSAFPSVNH